MIAHDPLHRSQRARLTHWAPPSGHHEQALVRIGVANPCVREKAFYPLPETPPKLSLRAMSLTSALKKSPPQPNDGLAKRARCRAVAGHTVIPHVSAHDATQVGPHLADGVMQSLAKLSFHFLQLAPHTLLLGLPKHDEFALSRLVATVRKAEKVKSLGLPVTLPSSILGRKAPELDDAGLLWVQLQTELCETLAQIGTRTLSAPGAALRLRLRNASRRRSML
jgi:hypothetical protein